MRYLAQQQLWALTSACAVYFKRAQCKENERFVNVSNKTDQVIAFAWNNPFPAGKKIISPYFYLIRWDFLVRMINEKANDLLWTWSLHCCHCWYNCSTLDFSRWRSYSSWKPFTTAMFYNCNETRLQNIPFFRQKSDDETSLCSCLDASWRTINCFVWCNARYSLSMWWDWATQVPAQLSQYESRGQYVNFNPFETWLTYILEYGKLYNKFLHPFVRNTSIWRL